MQVILELDHTAFDIWDRILTGIGYPCIVWVPKQLFGAFNGNYREPITGNS